MANMFVLDKENKEVFNSVAFVFLFLPVVLLLYLGVDRLKFRGKDGVLNFLLVAFSFVFYCWGGIKPLWGLLLLIAWNYGMALLASVPRGTRGKVFLAMGVIGNVAFFFYFKLLNSFISLFYNLFHVGFSLLELRFKVPDSTAFGYLLCQGREYDLAIQEGTASVLLMRKEFDSVGGKVALFKPF